MGAAGASIFIFLIFLIFVLPPPKVAANGRWKRPKRGAEGATPPEGGGNPAEGGYFASII